MPDLGAAADERTAHQKRGNGIVSVLRRVGVRELESRFVYGLRADNGGFRELYGVLGGAACVSAAGQAELADAGVILRVGYELVTAHQGMVGAQLIIEPRIDVRIAKRR